MDDQEDMMEFWAEKYPELLNGLREEHGDREMNVIGRQAVLDTGEYVLDRHESISEEIWNAFFLKSKNNIEATIKRNNESIRISNIEEYLYIAQFSGVFSNLFFLVNIRGASTSYRTTEEVLEHKLVDFDERLCFSSDKTKKFISVAKEVYGEDNVWFGLTYKDPELCIFNHIPKPAVIVKHPDFWCESEYGMSIKIINGFSVFYINNSGGYNVGRGPQFACSSQDGLLAGYGRTHPHTSTRGSSSRKYIKPTNICQGDGGQIRAAHAAYVDEDENEDVIYNFFLVYNNLLRREDLEGGPFWSMKDALLPSRDTDSNGVGSGELVSMVQQREVDIIVDVSEDKIITQISTDSLREAMANREAGDGIWFQNLKHRSFHKKELKDIAEPPIIYGTFTFNGQEIEIGIIEHDPDRYDLLGIEHDDVIWKRSDSSMPSDRSLEVAENIINGRVTANLIKNYEHQEVEKEDIEEEIVGLTSIKRNSDPSVYTRIA